MKSHLLISVKVLLVFTVITGLLYPLFVFGFAQIFFHGKANGSLIRINGAVIGSELLAQKFESAKYFHPRPSAIDYNPVPSGGSNYSLTHDSLRAEFKRRGDAFSRSNAIKDRNLIPPEMLFASASGVDPHISFEAAILQVERIAGARGFGAEAKQSLYRLVNEQSERTIFGLPGEKIVNVLKLNVALDELAKL